MQRYRAILYMTRSYIPWVCYWMFSAYGFRCAPVISLTIVALILIPQCRKKNYSLMDVVMLFYSVIAIVFNFYIKSDLFFKGDGYMGYGTLSIMAMTSIVFRYPFGRYYIEKENTEGRTFDNKEMSYIFSYIWLVVFLASTLIFAVIISPVMAIILSNIWVVFGIIGSIYEISKNCSK